MFGIIRWAWFELFIMLMLDFMCIDYFYLNFNTWGGGDNTFIWWLLFVL